MDQAFNYQELQERAVAALQDRFHNSAIKAAEGWHGRVHIKIVSPEFDGLTESRRQDVIWEVLKERLGPDAAGVSLVLPFGMDEI